jgi:putative glutathione S-transferase
MGLLVNGAWQEDISRTKEGRFIRPASVFRNFVTRDGSPGPSGEGNFAAEPGRYHLYVSLACPWAHRTLILRALKKLEPVISVSITEPLYGKTGWEFGTARGATKAHGKRQGNARRNLLVG